jgi:hypothetical protein
VSRSYLKSQNAPSALRQKGRLSFSAQSLTRDQCQQALPLAFELLLASRWAQPS